MLYFSFQKLEIYQLSKELVKYIYKLSSSFPSDEKYALVLQINRAAVSIASNIAEGTSRNGCQEKIHFINPVKSCKFTPLNPPNLSREIRQRRIFHWEANISQGAGILPKAKLFNEVNVSYSSLMEIVCQTEIAFELGYLTNDAFENISKKAKNLAVKMSNYIASIKKSNISTTFQPHFNHISTTFITIFNH